MDLSDVAGRIEAAGFGPIKWERNGSEFKICCPCHRERTPSCNFKIGSKGDVVAYCFGCRAKGEAIAPALGMDIKDWFAQPRTVNGNGARNGYRTAANPSARALPPADKPLQNIKTTDFRVCNPDGTLVAVHVRLDGTDADTGKPAKRMWWKLPDETKGLGGIKTTDLPLYGCQRLRNYPDAEYPILVEGEKAAQALIRRALPAVGTVCGAAVMPSDETLRPLLRFASITLWPDNDLTGMTHMERIARSLVRLVAREVRMLDVSQFEIGDDAADLSADFNVPGFLETGKIWQDTGQALTKPVIEDLPAVVIPWETRSAAEIANAAYLERTAIVDRLFYSSAISMITGGKHAGKSTLTRWLAICVAQGREFLGRAVVQGPVFYIASSDETMSARQELIRLGWTPADPLQFVSTGQLDGELEDLPRFFAALAEQLRNQGAALLVLDMLFDFMRVKDEMGYADTRKAVGEIEKIAAQSGAHIVVVHHAPKHATFTAEAAVTALGSQGLAARVSPIVLVRRLGPGIHNVTSTEVRDPRGQAIPLSRLSLSQDGSLSLGGKWQDYMQAEVYAPQVIEILEAEPGQELTAQQIAEQLECSYRTAAAACSQLYKEGKIGRTGSGQKGRPYRYALYAEAPAAKEKAPDKIPANAQLELGATDEIGE